MTSLRQRMTEDMQVRDLSLCTQALQVALFARHFHRSPEALRPGQIRTYQVFLVKQKKLAHNSVSLPTDRIKPGNLWYWCHLERTSQACTKNQLPLDDISTQLGDVWKASPKLCEKKPGISWGDLVYNPLDSTRPQGVFMPAHLRPLIYRTLICLICFVFALPSVAASQTEARFSISFTKAHGDQPIDGRLLLLLSNDSSAEPRMQIGESPRTQMVFGMDVEAMRPGQSVIVDQSASGYPVRNLRDVPAGEYYVQAVLHRYETFHRADGHTVKLPMDRGEGQHWNLAPGNLYSSPRKVLLGASSGIISIVLEQEIPPIPPPKDTKYIRHLEIQSQLLTKFWGRPIYLSANVLVPEGFDTHPHVSYPLIISEDHFNADFEGFRTEPPDPNLKPDYSERFHISGYNRIQQEEAYKLYQQWISPGFPRILIAEINHANPYYDDSYAVNSENLGPYGDAIETELIPTIEKQFRGIGQGWARFVYGGSTGGWEAMAVQMFYPDHYNGAFVACPDPVDFRAYTTINLYNDKNAFYVQGAHTQIAQPAMRDYLGRTFATVESMNQYELALGSHARSGEQFDIWQAVFGPVGQDGYPKPIFNKQTGDIDPAVAAYWKEHYDLSAILQRDWATLGPKLQGKLHIYVGSADTYFLNDAVYYLEDFLKSATNPPYEGEVKYGDRAEHCWNGDPNLPNYLSRLHYHTLYLPKILERMQKAAPPGADLTSWRY